MATIGVTGHRILTELDKINAGVGEALRCIAEAFPGQPVTVISSLAEGADRLVVRQVLTRPKARLVVPLPLPKSDYLADFESAESKKEFLSLLDQADEVIELPSTPTRTVWRISANRGSSIKRSSTRRKVLCMPIATSVSRT